MRFDYKRSDWICPVCGMWKYIRFPGKFGPIFTCPNAGRKDHCRG